MRHVDITGFVYLSSACYSCHPTGGEAPISTGDHSAKYFPIETGSHAELACTDCHTDASTSKTFVCTTCHTAAESAKQHADTSGYAFTDAGCYGCHPRGLGADRRRDVLDHDSRSHPRLGC